MRTAAVAALGFLAATMAQPASFIAPAEAGAPRSAPADTLPRYVRSGLSLYRNHPDARKVRRIADRWQEAGGPASAADSVAMAALWRRSGQTRVALGLLPPTGAGRVMPRAKLERARILFQATLVRPEEQEAWRAEAAEAFWNACENADAATLAELWLDLRGLATPDEQDEWAELPPSPGACPWVRTFVESRAMRMAVTVAERLELHYRRLRDARARYHLKTPRLTRDLTDRLGRADSLEIDDRGLLLLRMGEADATVETFMGLNETWAYFRPEGARIYHFAPVSKTGYIALGDFRMLENLAHASGFTMPSQLMGIGGGRLSHLYHSRRVLDYLFAESLFGQMDRRMRAAGDRFNPGLQGLLAWERERNEADARYAVQSIPGVPAVAPGVKFAYETLRFREPGGERMEVWVLASARAGDLTAVAGPPEEGGVRYHVAADLAMTGPGGYRLRSGMTDPVLDDPLRAEDGIPLRVPIHLDPGRYPFTLALRDAGAPARTVGNWVQDTLAVPAPLQGLPEVSDIAVAADSGGDWTRDGLSHLRVDPTHVVGASGVAHIYFEVYGLRSGEAYEVEVRVVAEQEAESIFDLGPEELAFTVDTPPGAYLLAVRTTELASGISSLPAITPIYRVAVPDAHWTEAPRRRSTVVNP
jgi:hypothetical protein